MSWREHAACRGLDPSIFFPPKGGRGGMVAKRICAICPVTAECLDTALRLGNAEADIGIWGGTGSKERRVLRRDVTPEAARDLGGRIRELREAAGLRQRDLAAVSGVDLSSLSRYERGVHYPTERTLRRIEGALGVQLREEAS